MENSSSLVGIEQLFRPQPGRQLGTMRAWPAVLLGLDGRAMWR